MTTNLEQLYYDQLRDLFSAKSQLVAALPELARRATDDKLRKTINGQLGQGREQRTQLQELFFQHGLNPGGEQCEAMRGLSGKPRGGWIEPLQEAYATPF